MGAGRQIASTERLGGEVRLRKRGGYQGGASKRAQRTPCLASALERWDDWTQGRAQEGRSGHGLPRRADSMLYVLQRMRLAGKHHG